MAPKIFGKVDHYVVTKDGGWHVKSDNKTHTLTGSTQGAGGRITVVITIDCKKGTVSKTQCTWRGTNISATVPSGKVSMSGAVVLNSVNAAGETLTRKAVIYNDFTV